MTIKNSGKSIIQKEKLIIYLFVLSVVFADILGNGNLNLLYFFWIIFVYYFYSFSEETLSTPSIGKFPD